MALRNKPLPPLPHGGGQRGREPAAPTVVPSVKPAAKQAETIRVPGLDQAIAVRRSPRAQRFRLAICPKSLGPVLTIPAHCRPEHAAPFLARNHAWLAAQLAATPQRIGLIDGVVVPVRGVPHRLVAVARDRKRPVVASEPLAADAAERFASDIAAPMQLAIQCQPDHVGSRARAWLMAEARRDLARAVAHHAERLGVKPARIVVRDQTSRWGSCAANGTLSFSWRLILAPHFVLDYVAAHEVAHLREMNHSPRFWAHVRTSYGDYARARAWLKAHGPQLHAYGL